MAITLIAGIGTGAMKKIDLKPVTVDTTVQEKVVMYLTDLKSLNRIREHLVETDWVAGYTVALLIDVLLEPELK